MMLSGWFRFIIFLTVILVSYSLKFSIPLSLEETCEAFAICRVGIYFERSVPNYRWEETCSKGFSTIKVTLEDGNVLVVKSNNCGKRKRDKGEEEDCRYLKLERKASPKFQRKLRLPENANLSAITAKWVNGMLTVVVEKLPPPPEAKLKTVEVKIS